MNALISSSSEIEKEFIERQYGRITSVIDLPRDKDLIKQIKDPIKVHDAGVKPRPAAGT